MKVKICYDKDVEEVDIIDVPIADVNYIEQLQKEFFKWLFDKSNDHKYWVYDLHRNKTHCDYDVDAFVSWMNQYQFNGDDGECAICVAKDVSGTQYNYPILYF